MPNFLYHSVHTHALHIFALKYQDLCLLFPVDKKTCVSESEDYVTGVLYGQLLCKFAISFLLAIFSRLANKLIIDPLENPNLILQ